MNNTPGWFVGLLIIFLVIICFNGCQDQKERDRLCRAQGGVPVHQSRGDDMCLRSNTAIDLYNR
jgi:hypothetical protein